MDMVFRRCRHFRSPHALHLIAFLNSSVAEIYPITSPLLTVNRSCFVSSLPVIFVALNISLWLDRKQTVTSPSAVPSIGLCRVSCRNNVASLIYKGNLQVGIGRDLTWGNMANIRWMINSTAFGQ